MLYKVKLKDLYESELEGCYYEDTLSTVLINADCKKNVKAIWEMFFDYPKKHGHSYYLKIKKVELFGIVMHDNDRNSCSDISVEPNPNK